MLTVKQLDALNLAAQAARRCEASTGCPAALSVAQWALESGWGNYAPGNNCFGIKFFAGAAGSQKIQTHEFLQGKSVAQELIFATFPSLEACFEKHATLITTGAPYREAWANYLASADSPATNGRIEELVDHIAPRYAPGNTLYAMTVKKIMAMPQVKAALIPAEVSS